MHPQDERALKLTQALRQYDLDSLLGLVRPRLHRPLDQLRSNLLPVFTQAAQDKVDLLMPPANFHTWLHAPLRHTRSGPNTARPNTVITRLSTLTRLYEALIDEGLLTLNPVRGCPAPTAEHKTAPLPSPTVIARLLAEAQVRDDVLFAALTLTYHHAFQLTELLTLQWRALDFSRGELLRARTVSPLGNESLQALQPLLTRAGGPLHVQDSNRAVFPYADRWAFRHVLWTLCRDAGVPNISPSDLRKAGLRDHPQTLAQAGFSNAQAYERAFRYARKVVERPDPT